MASVPHEATLQEIVPPLRSSSAFVLPTQAAQLRSALMLHEAALQVVPHHPIGGHHAPPIIPLGDIMPPPSSHWGTSPGRGYCPWKQKHGGNLTYPKLYRAFLRSEVQHFYSASEDVVCDTLRCSGMPSCIPGCIMAGFLPIQSRT